MITVITTILVSQTKAWEYFTQPNHIVHWNFASADWCCPTATNDLYVGGSFCYRMEAKDGSFGFDLEGSFTLIEPPYALHYQLTDGRRVEVKFDAVKPNSTLITQQFEPEQMNSKELQQAGWQAILNQFKHYTESINE